MPRNKKPADRNIWFRRISPTVQLALASTLFAISVLITSTSGIANWEIDLFNAIYNLPRFLHPLFFIITQLGSIWVLAFLLGLYLFKKHYHAVVRFLMTGTLAYLVSGVAKDLWGRARPNDFLENILNLDYVVRGPGFPSGHTALATALAFTMGHYLPKKYHWVIYIWVIGVGLSRMYLGIHFPMDIVGGFAIGWGSYALFRHVRLQDTASKPKIKTKNRKLRKSHKK